MMKKKKKQRKGIHSRIQISMYTNNNKANVKNGLMKAKQRHTGKAVSSQLRESKNYAQEKILTHSEKKNKNKNETERTVIVS